MTTTTTVQPRDTRYVALRMDAAMATALIREETRLRDSGAKGRRRISAIVADAVDWHRAQGIDPIAGVQPESGRGQAVARVGQVDMQVVETLRSVPGGLGTGYVRAWLRAYLAHRDAQAETVTPLRRDIACAVPEPLAARLEAVACSSTLSAVAADAIRSTLSTRGAVEPVRAPAGQTMRSMRFFVGGEVQALVNREVERRVAAGMRDAGSISAVVRDCLMAAFLGREQMAMAA